METTFVLALIALLMAIVIIGIWWGAVLKRRRVAGEEQLLANREAAEEGTPGSTHPQARPPRAETSAPPASSPPSPTDKPVTTAIAAPAIQEAAAAPAAADLTQLKGLGPKLAATLAELGFTRIEQIAALSPEQASALDAQLGAFQGRMARDRWIEQAILLSAGDRAAYEAAFGKLGG